MNFYFHPFSVRLRFYDVQLYFSAHKSMYTCFRCARNRYIMQIYFAEFCRGQSVTAENMLNVHHIHTLFCEVFKWNYEHYSTLILILKADMKSYIPLETAAIFFLANPFPKQGISSEYVTADFICMG